MTKYSGLQIYSFSWNLEFRANCFGLQVYRFTYCSKLITTLVNGFQIYMLNETIQVYGFTGLKVYTSLQIYDKLFWFMGLQVYRFTLHFKLCVELHVFRICVTGLKHYVCLKLYIFSIACYDRIIALI